MNKVALITGGAKRIGACLAESLHLNGMNVILHYRHSSDEAKDLVEKLNGLRANSAHCLQASLDDYEQINKLAADAINCWGNIDVLINNASSFFPTKMGTATESQWDNLFNSNLKGSFFLIQALQDELKRQKGCIVNLVDIHAERPLKDHTLYCMAKAGVAMMTKSLAKELAPEVRVNGISPGAILWPENEAELSDTTKQEVLQRIPLARSGNESDIAMTALFLIENAPYITGQIISVDGGRTLSS